MLATMVDVARRAGVATSTVSHVLNRTRFVSPERTRAVQEAVEAVGYTPNTLARALARSMTNTVGLAISSSRNRYFGDFVNAIERECAALGMMVLLANTRDDPEEEARAVMELHRRRVDGIILAPSGGPDAPAFAYLRQNAVPVVLVDRLPEAGFDGVGVENSAAMATLVDHLAGHGHRRIGLVAGQASFTTTAERVAGTQSALRRQGLDGDGELISPGHTDAASARAAAAAMLALPAPPTAFIGGNNLCTVGIMMALRDARLSVPHDVALASFDDFECAECFEPALTAMAQPCEAIGQRAAALLQRRIGDDHTPPSTLRMAPALIRRRSCGCP